MNIPAVDTLGALEVFLGVADQLSFADAGRRLGLSASAAGKSVSRLEAKLGVRLFHRTTRRISLTAEGELLYEAGRRIRGELDEVVARLAEAAAEPQGRLRVSLPTIGYRFLAPALPDFARAYPKIRLDLEFSDATLDLVAEGFDAAIRSGNLPDSAMMSRRIGDFRFMLCAAPSYLARAGTPRSTEALRDHALVRYRWPGTDRLQDWAWIGSAESAMEGSTSVTCTNMEAVLALTVRGLGVSCMPNFLAAESLGRNELIELLPGKLETGSFWLVWPGGAKAPPKLRAFADFASRLFTSGL